MRMLWTIGLIACCLGIGACDRTAAQTGDAASPDAASKNEPADESEASDADVDALLALPYAGWVEDDDAEAEVGLLYIDRERSYPGYTLISVSALGAAILIDHEGGLAHAWQASAPTHWGPLKLLESGEILGVGQELDSAGLEHGYAYRMSWTGEMVWQERLAAHHEVDITPDGGVIALTKMRRPAIRVSDNGLAILNANREVIETLSLYDLITAKPDLFPLRPRKARARGIVDLLHCNSIEWMVRKELFDRHPLYGPDNVLICSRHQDRVFVVDTKRREIVWAWGAEELSGPHDATILSNGNLLVLDNGVARRQSRALEMDPLTGEIVWEYTRKGFFTRFYGSAQRLPNGNTLIADSDKGECFEVTRDGEVVWHYRIPIEDQRGRRATFPRAARYESELIQGLSQRFGADPTMPTAPSEPSRKPKKRGPRPKAGG